MASIQGIVYLDLDDDGQQDAGERGVVGAGVDLVDRVTLRTIATQRTGVHDLNNDGLIDPVTEQGHFQFDNQPDGDYIVRPRLASGVTRSGTNQLQFLDAGSLPVGDTPLHVTGVDLDNDGHQDLVAAQLLPGDLSVLQNQGDGTFAAAEVIDAGAVVGVVKAAVLLSDTDSGLGPAIQIPVGAGPHGINTGDVDLDGYLDLITGNQNAGSITVLSGDGAGGFTFAGEVPVGGGTQFPALVDLDADGVQDLAVANSSGDNVSRILNFTGSYSVSITEQQDLQGIDFGIDNTHSFFGADRDGDGVPDRIVYQYDYVDDDADATDEDGHGTHVSSIVGSEDSTYPGVAPGVNLIHLRVLDENGGGSFSDIEAALQWVVANTANYGIVAVNMSLGTISNYSTPQELHGIHDELQALAELNVLTVAASGNRFFQYGAPGVAYPAADEHVISVGSVWDASVGSQSWVGGARDETTDTDRLVSHSQRHNRMTDVLAPGAQITAASPGNLVVPRGGTSMASPHVAGAAALIQQLARRELGRPLTPDEFRDLLRSAGAVVNDGDDEDDNVPNTGLDFVRLDVFAMAEEVMAMAEPGPGTWVVQLTTGEEATDLDFGNFSDRGWARAAGQDGQNAPSPDDTFTDVTVDPWGNAITVGSTYAYGDSGNNRSDGDILVESRSPTGHLNWRYVTGSADDELDNAGDDDDRARDVTVDASGNVYIVGSFRNTVDFDPAAQHAQNDDELTSNASFDAFLVKLDRSGQFQWVRQFGGTSGVWDLGNAVTISPDGNVLVAGQFGGTVDFDPLNSYPDNHDRVSSAGRSDVFLAVVNPDGEFQQVFTMGGPLNDGAAAVAVDRANRIYLTGTFRGTADFDRPVDHPDGRDRLTAEGNADAFVLKMSDDGQLLWVRGIGGLGYQATSGIVVNSHFEVITAGLFQSTPGNWPRPSRSLSMVIPMRSRTRRCSSICRTLWEQRSPTSRLWVR